MVLTIQVALKNFVDDVASLAVEQSLLKQLESIFTTETVFRLSDEEVRRLAGETKATTGERIRWTQKLAGLEEGLKILKGLDRFRTPSTRKHSHHVIES